MEGEMILIVVLLLVVIQAYFLLRFSSFTARVEDLLTELARK